MVYDRWGTSWGTGINCAILGFFGYECYVGMQFTKTAGLCTLTGGLLFIIHLKHLRKNGYSFRAYYICLPEVYTGLECLK